MVYILKFRSPLGNDRHRAQYYVGWCNDDMLDRRLWHHRNGTGAAITRAAAQRGIDFDVILTIPGATRTDERRIKNQKNTARFVARYHARQGHGSNCA